MSSVRWTVPLALVLSSVLACRGEHVRPTGDTTAAAASPSLTPPSAGMEARWNSGLGRAVLISSQTAAESTFIVQPDYVEGRYDDTSTFDVRPLSGVRFDLFGRSGFFGTATLTASVYKRPGGDACTSWPPAMVSDAKAGWRVGLETGHVTAIAFDSIEAMSSSDSAMFAAHVTRLAASIPSTRDSIFSSVPFVVRSAYRFQTSTIDGIIATVQRSIPSEATPREDNVLLIAERAVGSTAEYSVGFSKRTTGAADSAQIIDVLTAVTLTQEYRPLLVVSYEDNDGSFVGFIERVSPGVWQATWRSDYVGC